MISSLNIRPAVIVWLIAPKSMVRWVHEPVGLQGVAATEAVSMVEQPVPAPVQS